MLPDSRQRIEVSPCGTATNSSSAPLPDIGPPTVRVLLSELPELGHLSPGQSSKLIGIASLNRDIGQRTGARQIWDARAHTRGPLQATVVATRYDLVIRFFCERLRNEGKPPKAALVAAMDKLLNHPSSQLNRVTNQDSCYTLADRQRLSLHTGYLGGVGYPVVSLKPSPMFEQMLPSKPFEAMAADRPIVLSVGGEACCVLEQAGAGIPVPGDASAAIRDLAIDPDRRSRLGESRRAFVAREFTRDDWAGEMLQHLERIGTTR